MRLQTGRLFLAGWASLFVACSGSAPAQTSSLRADSIRAVRVAAGTRVADRLLEYLQPFTTAPGMSAAVATGGDLVWTGVHGWADVADSLPVTPGSRFRLASVSKLFTATLALRSIETGDLDPDADIRVYVPAWPDHDGASITARQLAAHTAGINHYESLAASEYVSGQHYPDIMESLAFFDEAPLLAPPGQAYSYSSFGYALLNAVVLGASGQSLATGLETQLLGPLGLEETSLEDVRSLPSDAVTLYRADSDGRTSPAELDDQSFVWGATGMRSTPRDLVRFGDAFLSGELVSIATRDWALTPARLVDGSTVRTDRYEVGFGWRVGQDWDGRRVAHHAGSTRGARTVLLTYPDHRAVVALVVNGTWTSRIETTAELIAASFMEDGADGEACPAGEWGIAGTLEEEFESGTLTLGVEAGLCTGHLESEGALASRWSELSNPPRTFPVVGVARRDDAHIFALAYPWGLARLTVRQTDHWLDIDGDIVGWPLVLRATPQPE